MPYASIEKRRESFRKHYRLNKLHYFKKAKDYTRMVNAQIQTWLLEYLLSHPCVDCGEKNPIPLEFDHRADTVKEFEIGAVTSGGYSLKRVIAEVAKCEVRCVNCHSKKTYVERAYTVR